MSKVTKEAINAKITDVSFIHLPGTTVTICSITLENGYSVRGESACVDPAGYVESVGRDLAYQNAFDKIWPLEGYLLAEKLHCKANIDVSWAKVRAAKEDILRLSPTPATPDYPYSQVPDGQQRVTDEFEEITSRLAMLLEFKTLSTYAALPSKTKSLLCRQANAMHDYADALKCRIEMF